MEIQLKLMGMLKSKSPPEGKLQLPEGATIADALRALDIAAESVQVFTVNGRLIRDREHALTSGDELSVLPPVGGG